MNRIDFDTINHSMNPADVVPQWLPDGRKQGNEWVARNPTRNDNKPGSFSISLATGQWSDFATDERGGDLVSLYAYLFHSGDNGKAARELAENKGIDIGSPEIRQRTLEKVAKLDDARPQLILPAPADAVAAVDFHHFQHGEPSMVWPYYSMAGDLLLYVCRFDHQDGSKDIIPRSWCDHPGKGARWTWRGITGSDPRPLYGLDKLAANPHADAVVFEGEKAADAGQRLLGDAAVAVAWLGGTATADMVDVKALRHRRVILWPDFDSQTYKDGHERAGELKDLHEQPGVKAMIRIAQRLAGVSRETLMVGYDPTHPSLSGGWDIADAEQWGWQQTNVMEYMGLHADDPYRVAGGQQQDQQDVEQQQDVVDAPAAAQQPEYISIDAMVNPFGWPHQNDKGQPLSTCENLQYMLNQYGITCRYNVIAKDVEIDIPGRRYSQDNRAANSLSMVGNLCSRNRLNKGDLADYITMIADANPYNPAIEWIESHQWDGVDRFRQLAATLDPVDIELATMLLRRWMIGATAAAAMDGGAALQGVMVLQGPQGTGKTTWFWTLAGNDRHLGKEGAQLNPADRDSVKSCISYWLVELGELDATFRKADIAALKSFLTKDQDELFLRYSRAVSSYPRRTAFMATVNEQTYLKDETGNRRYWSIQCGANMQAKHDVDVQQVWAQAYHLMQTGEPFALNKDEAARLNTVNEDHTEVSPVEELLRVHYDWDSQARYDAKTATDALLAIGYDRPNRQQTREAGQVLRKLTGGEPRKSNGRHVFDMPPVSFNPPASDPNEYRGF